MIFFLQNLEKQLYWQLQAKPKGNINLKAVFFLSFLWQLIKVAAVFKLRVYHGYVTYLVGCCMLRRYNCFISKQSWYLHSVAFTHIHSCYANASAPSKLNTQWVRAISFFIYIFTKRMHKSQCVYYLISCLLVIFWAFQSFCSFACKT